MKKWHFNDLHAFKDYVTFVRLCAPDDFPVEDYLQPDEQWTLDRAFEGLQYGIALTEKEKGELPILGTCKQLVEEAYAHYREGRVREGFVKLEEMQNLLQKIPSQ